MTSYEKILNMLLESSDDSDKGIVKWGGTVPAKPISAKDLKELINRLRATSAAKKKKTKQRSLNFPG